MCSSLNATVPGRAPQMKQQFPCTMSAIKRLQLKKTMRSSLVRMEPSTVFLNIHIAPNVADKLGTDRTLMNLRSSTNCRTSLYADLCRFLTLLSIVDVKYHNV